MAIMTGEKGADIRSLKDELNWYRGRISEHLFVLDQEAVSEYVENMEDASAGDILAINTTGLCAPSVTMERISSANISPAEASSIFSTYSDTAS